MKKLVLIFLAAMMAASLAACSETPSEPSQPESSAVESVAESSAASSEEPSVESSTAEETTEVPDLSGEWVQVNNNSEDTWQAATIDENTITIYWVSDNGDTKSLYWAGTFVPPENTDEPYTWDSENDTEQTSMALLASGDEIKTFTYENGQISYEASALGTTTTVRLEKEE